MSGIEVEVTSGEGINVIRLNRPEKKNALSLSMYCAICDALDAGERDGDIRAHVLLGSHGVFSSGNDIGDFLSASGGEAAGLDDVLRFLRLLPMVKKPIIAGVDGPAIGIGTTLLFHCDLVFASDASRFSTPFVDLGLVPEAGASLLAPQRLGYARAFELLVLGEVFSAERMRDAGLVNAVVSVDEVEGMALQAARRLAEKPATALALSRSLLRGDMVQLGERIEAEVRVFKERLTSEEAALAFRAFFTKGSSKPMDRHLTMDRPQSVDRPKSGPVSKSDYLD
ncbi:MAG: crotonase/enoyl-CoA hydratase family protein [Alphaproteobacteria bacterium]|nr:crotonase/enoyl-CoA hydratase family protein [Alphaproteobacteria bacterium]